MSLFNGLKRELQAYLTEKQIDQVIYAYQFAVQAHAGQRRRSGDPYITHPLSVAKILAQVHMDTQTIIAAILHDVLEDTPIEKQGISELFGSEIADLVDAVSKLTHVQSISKAEAKAENFRKMLLAMAKDIRVIIIKLADRLHNMSTLSAMPKEKRLRIAKETLEIYAPIAQRLGMHTISIELEDLCFSNLYPYRYSVLQLAAKKSKRKHEVSLRQIEKTLEKGLIGHGIALHAIGHKSKHLYQIYKNMKEKHRTFNEIMDKPVFYIIVETVDDCYRSLGVIHHLFKPLPEQFRDYIAVPKTNGYQALHTTLCGPSACFINIQIRTLAMDHRADYGVTHHLSNLESDQQCAHIKACAWLQQLSDLQKITPDSLEFIETIKADLFPTDVYIFTPKGDIIELPNHATPIDLAYAIHSDLGNHCVAARIDQHLAPLSMHLSSGQKVEIITDVNTAPRSSWLNFVVTGKARSHIRQFLKTQQYSEAILFGQRLIDNALVNLGSSWSYVDPKIIDHLLQVLDYKGEEDLLEAVGFGHLSTDTVLEHIGYKEVIASIHTKHALLINGTESALIKFAECCRPIPDDEIMGVFTLGRGLTVHMKRCKFVNRSLKRNPEKALPLEWEETLNGHFKVELRIEAINKRGVLAQLTNKITQENVSIDTLKLENRDKEHAIIHLVLSSVRNRKHLACVLRAVRTLKTVFKIHRGK